MKGLESAAHFERLSPSPLSTKLIRSNEHVADRYVHGQGILFEVGPSFIRHFGAAYKERRQQQITGRPLKSRVKDPLHNETSAVSAQRPIWSACDMQILPALLFWSFLKKLKCVGTCLGAQVNFWKKIVLLRKHLLFDLCGNLTMSCSKPRTDFMPLADYFLRTLYLACYEFFPPLSSSSVVQRKNGTVNSNVPPPE